MLSLEAKDELCSSIRLLKRWDLCRALKERTVVWNVPYSTRSLVRDIEGGGRVKVVSLHILFILSLSTAYMCASATWSFRIPRIRSSRIELVFKSFTFLFSVAVQYKKALYLYAKLIACKGFGIHKPQLGVMYENR